MLSMRPRHVVGGNRCAHKIIGTCPPTTCRGFIVLTGLTIYYNVKCNMFKHIIENTCLYDDYNEKPCNFIHKICCRW